jgi:hypothetical protein
VEDDISNAASWPSNAIARLDRFIWSCALFRVERCREECRCLDARPVRTEQHTVENQALLCPSDLASDYEQLFISEDSQLDGSVIALAPPRHHARLFSQGGYFTLHRDLDQGLEAVCPAAVTRIEIPRKVFPEARTFLQLAGINEFSLFPDLDGLCRHLMTNDLNY